MSLTGALSLPSQALAADDVYLGVERLTGIFAERLTRKVEEGNVTQQTSNRTTSVAVLALRSQSAATLPRLALDVFVSGPISVGGSFVYTTYSQSSVFSADGNAQDQEDDLGSGSLWALMPRAGYRLEFTDSVGLWPHAGFLFASQSDTVVVDPAANTERKTSHTTLSLSLDGMFYFMPMDGLLLSGGPFLDLGGLYGSFTQETGNNTEADGDAKLTAFGLSFGLGILF